MANGRVCTGYSHPMAASYAASAGTVTYTDPFIIARGVSVDISLTTSSGTSFYADNSAQETSPGKFVSGTVTLTNDDPLPGIAKKIYGLPEEKTLTMTGSTTVKYQGYGKQASYPYLGVGFIVRFQQDGVESFVPVVLTKVRFSAPNTRRETQGEEMSYQTATLTGTMALDDGTDKNWKFVFDEQTTEAAAVAVLEKFLGKAS